MRAPIRLLNSNPSSLTRVASRRCTNPRRDSGRAPNHNKVANVREALLLVSADGSPGRTFTDWREPPPTRALPEPHAMECDFFAAPLLLLEVVDLDRALEETRD
jgi:hypothetical protein